MRLEFYDWNCGARDAPPAPIDDLSMGRAVQVLKTLSAALEQDASCRARLVDGDGERVEFHITPRRVIAT